MIKSITVKNDANETLTIELGAPETSGLWVKSIKGLGPGKADINVTDLASSDGSIFNSSRSEKRNITMTLGIVSYITEKNGKKETVSVETTRQNLYRWFAKKKHVYFIVHTDNIDLITDGYVESNEPDIFNKQETTSISIICPDPNMYLATEDNKYVRDGDTFSGTDDIFEFPDNYEGDGYENEVLYKETDDTSMQEGKTYYECNDGVYSVTSDTEFIEGKIYYESCSEYFVTSDTELKTGKEYYEKEGTYDYYLTEDKTFQVGKTYYEHQDHTIFSEIIDEVSSDLVYKGQIEVGLEFFIHITGEVSGLSIYKILGLSEHETISLDDKAITDKTGGPLNAGDDIYINTSTGVKEATLTRNAVTYNILNALGKNPDWFKLTQGLNQFSFDAVSGLEHISMSVNFIGAYEGI